MDTAGSTPQPAEEYTVVPGKTEANTPIFAVLVKRTYDIRPGHTAVRAARTPPLLKTDVYYDNGDAELATVQYETDLVPYKLATDVVCIGKAYAGQPVAQLDVALRVGGFCKTIRVIGDRQCLYRGPRPPAFTEPGEFSEMAMRYERAYGGTYLRHDPIQMFPYPRNPMGTGFTLTNTAEVIDGLILPNLEDPTDLLTPERLVVDDPYRWHQQPLPQGFGWLQRTWYPRCVFVGSVPGFVEPDAIIPEELLGFLPTHHIALARQFKLPSFDVRFNTGASLGLALPYLSGSVPLTLVNLTPESPLDFLLPNDVPQMMLDIGLGENALPAVLHTVCIRADDRQVDLVWRGAHEYPGIEWLPEMKRMAVQVI